MGVRPKVTGRAKLTYEAALAEARKVGVAHASDAGLMAGLLASSLQILCGALSPKLVWEGAQRKGLTSLELARLMNTDPASVEELMWL